MSERNPEITEGECSENKKGAQCAASVQRAADGREDKAAGDERRHANDWSHNIDTNNSEEKNSSAEANQATEVVAEVPKHLDESMCEAGGNEAAQSVEDGSVVLEDKCDTTHDTIAPTDTDSCDIHDYRKDEDITSDNFSGDEALIEAYIQQLIDNNNSPLEVEKESSRNVFHHLHTFNGAHTSKTTRASLYKAIPIDVEGLSCPEAGEPPEFVIKLRSSLQQSPVLFLAPNHLDGESAKQTLDHLCYFLSKEEYDLFAQDATGQDGFRVDLFVQEISGMRFEKPAVIRVTLGAEGVDDIYYKSSEKKSYAADLRNKLISCNLRVIFTLDLIHSQEEKRILNKLKDCFTVEIPDPDCQIPAGIKNSGLCIPDQDAYGLLIFFVAAFFPQLDYAEFHAVVVYLLKQEDEVWRERESSKQEATAEKGEAVSESDKCLVDRWRDDADSICLRHGVVYSLGPGNDYKYRFKHGCSAKDVAELMLDERPAWLTSRVGLLLRFYFETDSTSKGFLDSLINLIIKLANRNLFVLDAEFILEQYSLCRQYKEIYGHRDRFREFTSAFLGLYKSFDVKLYFARCLDCVLQDSRNWYEQLSKSPSYKEYCDLKAQKNIPSSEAHKALFQIFSLENCETFFDITDFVECVVDAIRFRKCEDVVGVIVDLMENIEKPLLEEYFPGNQPANHYLLKPLSTSVFHYLQKLLRNNIDFLPEYASGVQGWMQQDRENTSSVVSELMIASYFSACVQTIESTRRFSGIEEKGSMVYSSMCNGPEHAKAIANFALIQSPYHFRRFDELSSIASTQAFSVKDTVQFYCTVIGSLIEQNIVCPKEARQWVKVLIHGITKTLDVEAKKILRQELRKNIKWLRTVLSKMRFIDRSVPEKRRKEIKKAYQLTLRKMEVKQQLLRSL